MTPNVPASIKARLLAGAKERGEAFELCLVRYACERFLYRLGESVLRDRCTLKGACLLSVWMEDPYRATRDLDFLASGDNSEAAIRAMMEVICAVSCPEDGLLFELDTLSVSPIQAGQKYSGHQTLLFAFLGKARIRLKVDFGFGDAAWPQPEEVDYPTLIKSLPAPSVRTYPRVASVAEKLEAMVDLGRRNSRMKDFHDVWALAGTFSFDGEVLFRAIELCFERRGTAWTEEMPEAFTPLFYADVDLQSRWLAYCRAGGFRVTPPTSFAEIGVSLMSFFVPARTSIVERKSRALHWQAGGPWHE